jgi:tRNA (cytidine/uridine-2'-O-)-methyltransferase
MHIVLVEPEIPPNTGNVARLCAATKSILHLIEPFGFKLDDSQLKRAGMDYWRHVEWHRWKNWTAFEEKLPADARLWFIESGGGKNYSDVKFSPDDHLVFGRETAGLPKQLLEQHRELWLRIPMFQTESRSLNLSNCVALVLFEALRQQGFGGEIH